VGSQGEVKHQKKTKIKKTREAIEQEELPFSCKEGKKLTRQRVSTCSRGKKTSKSLCETLPEQVKGQNWGWSVQNSGSRNQQKTQQSTRFTSKGGGTKEKKNGKEKFCIENKKEVTSGLSTPLLRGKGGGGEEHQIVTEHDPLKRGPYPLSGGPWGKKGL